MKYPVQMPLVVWVLFTYEKYFTFIKCRFSDGYHLLLYFIKFQKYFKYNNTDETNMYRIYLTYG